MRHATSPALASSVVAAAILAPQASAGDCVPAPNEECDTAILFTTADLPYQVADILGCTNDQPDRPYFDVFYQYDCTTTALHRFDMCGTTGDSYMRIYADDCSFGGSTFWVEDDDACPGSPNTLDPMIDIEMEAGHSYWIELGAWRDAIQFPPNANDPYMFSVAIVLPCPADLALPEGELNFDDVIAFLTAFATMDPAADFALPVGVFDFSDVIGFLQAFAAGCP